MKMMEKLVQGLIRRYGGDFTDYQLKTQSQFMLEINRKLAIQQNKKMHVVFVCHRGSLWNSMKTLYEACIKDDDIDVTIVTIPNKKQDAKLGLNHEEYIDEGAAKFFENYDCNVINGYDTEKKKWLDLQSLEPDYLFFQTPYDICRPMEYRSKTVCLYTKLCYINYGMSFIGGISHDESHPEGYLKNCYFTFSEYEEAREYNINRAKENAIHKHERVLTVGYPKLDERIKYYDVESSSWKQPKEKNLKRVMWTPRWCTDEGNCTFFDYKDKLPKYMESRSDVEFLFRPHPQAFSNFLARGEMSEKEITDYKEYFEKSDHMGIDPQIEYLPSFYSSDILISDESSIMPEYFLTGKPIIFTYNQVNLNGFGTKIAKEGFYWAKNYDELIKVLEMLLEGNDPLYEKRQELIASEFYLPKEGAGEYIKKCLKNDYYKSRI